jgi:EmrB/QacA subfamily drug resistance transporter
MGADANPQVSETNAVDVARSPTQEVTRYWGTTVVLLVGTFISVLDFFIVNVAIPSIQRNLHASPAGIEFIVVGFALALGSGLIIGGRLGDIFGRRRMFTLGLVLFIISSASCGAAPSITVLVISRVAQGLSAALMGPQVLTILGITFSGHLRVRAFNAYGVTMGLAAVFGQLIGGVLIRADILGWGWRSCFLINIPIGVVALLLVPRHVPESFAPGRQRLDLVGMVLAALALTALILPVVEGRQQGWPLWAWLSLAASFVLFTIFALYEHRLTQRGGSPLVDLALFRERAFTAGLSVQLVFWTGSASFFLVFALYLQLGRGLDALHAGLIFIAIGSGYMVTSTTARFAAARLGRQVITLGGLLCALALCFMTLTVELIGVGGNILWLAPTLAIDGAGMGLAVAPLAATVLSRITPQHAGAATGVLTTGVQVGNALGVAIVGVIFYGVLDNTHTVNAYAHAFGFSLVYLIFAALAVAALVQLLPRAPAAAK